MKTDKDQYFMQRAIELAEKGMNSGAGGPFGAVVVNSAGEIVGEGHNQVTTSNDPTAHAEVVAIRNACKNLNDFQLEGCTIYTSCEPCPMCLGAIYWARPARIIFGCSRQDAADIGFDDDFIYREINVDFPERKIATSQLLQQQAIQVFRKWQEKEDRVEY